MVITPASQAGDDGSIPFARSIFPENPIRLIPVADGLGSHGIEMQGRGIVVGDFIP